MKKFLFLIVVPVLMVSRLAAQTVDTTNLDQHDVPTVILMDSDFEESSTSVNDASTLLNSSRDVFNSIAAYNFGSLRYCVRGNDSKYSEVMINGISMNDPRRSLKASARPTPALAASVASQPTRHAPRSTASRSR